MSRRLDAPFGSWIRRDQVIDFRFENTAYQGLAGDTIASALIANGEWLLARSFKYHRARSVFTMSGDDANALVQLPQEPNVAADRHPLTPGLEVLGQHYRGSLKRDRDRWIEYLSRFLPVGFHYRAFHDTPDRWQRWEKTLRAKAGLGRIVPGSSPKDYDKRHEFAHSAVIGGGAAGMTAALGVAETGREVFLIERAPHLGGALNYARFDAEGVQGQEMGRELLVSVHEHPNIHIMTDATCSGVFADNWLAVTCGRRLHKIRVEHLIVATGTIGQPAVFRNNDLPGIVHGSAAQRLLRLYGVRPGRRAVIFTANGEGYGVALDLLEAGVEIAAIIDSNEQALDDIRVAALGDQVEILRGHCVVEAHGKNEHVAALTVRAVKGGAQRRIACDLVCIEVGSMPAASLLVQAGADFAYDESQHGMVLGKLPPKVHAAGAVNGTWDLDMSLMEGRQTGWSATSGQRIAGMGLPDEWRNPGNHAWPICPHPKGKEFVDFDADLDYADLRNTVAEGFRSIEPARRFSGLGVGPSQGRISATNAVRILAKESHQALSGAHGWTQRPPVFAEKIAQLAGRKFAPQRQTPLHERHRTAEAAWVSIGEYLCPAYYGREREQAVTGEVAAIRNQVGLIDLSPLAGFDIRGPDAAEFLEYLTTGRYQDLPVGQTRYALLCNNNGTIFDHGIASRLGEQHFYLTGSSEQAIAVHRKMLWWNAQWRLQVDIANLSSALAVINLAGPQARRVLSKLTDDIDPANSAFPCRSVRNAQVAGIAARILRTGFVGEVSYELHVPASQAEALWDALLQAGSEFGIRPVGYAAQGLLRLEKGHLLLGQDSDEHSLPMELGLERMIAADKPFFVGQRALQIQQDNGPSRKLVGFSLPVGNSPPLREGHLVVRDKTIVGHVCSVAHSPTLNTVIGLAYVAPDQARLGQTFTIKGPNGRLVSAALKSLPFYDPQNQRQEI